MDREPDPDVPKPPKSSRENRRDDRLKAALKANMGRRKAQARQRAAAEDAAPERGDEAGGDEAGGDEAGGVAENDTRNR